MKYTLVVDENTTLELVSLKRCTSVLSEDSDGLSTICDDEVVDEDIYGQGQMERGMRPGFLLSSSEEDSSPEADLPFSKKFLMCLSTARHGPPVSEMYHCAQYI